MSHMRRRIHVPLMIVRAFHRLQVRDCSNLEITIGTEEAAVRSKVAVNDGMWHYVVMTWQSKDGALYLFVDGQERYTCKYVRVCVCVQVRVYIYIYVCIYVHMYIGTRQRACQRDCVSMSVPQIA
jgi:hypothetical protein